MEAVSPPPLPSPMWREFASREWEVIVLLTHDLDTDEIMARLFLERNSVYNLKRSLGSKLELQGKDAVNKYARKHCQALRMWYPILCRKPRPGFDVSPSSCA